MGIIDTIKAFFAPKQKGSKDPNKAIDEVKKAASSQNYNMASIKAFYALETLGEVYTETLREQHQTAREYGKSLVDDGFTTQEEIEPIILNFELAKYSEMQVSFDDYSKTEQSLETVAKKLKSGKSSSGSRSSSGRKKKSRKRRRKPSRGGKTGAARRRRGSGSDESDE